MDRALDRQEQEKVRTARANFFRILKRKGSTGQTTQPEKKTSTSTSTAQPYSVSPDKRIKLHTMSPSKGSGSGSNIPLIIRFYDPNTPPDQARDPHHRTLDEILSWNDARLESCHNYIQMLFPLPEGSPYNWDAPVITRQVMLAFRSRVELRDRLRESFDRMLGFYGFTLTTRSGEYEIEEVEGAKESGAEGAKAPRSPQETGSEQSAQAANAANQTSADEPHHSPLTRYYVYRAPHWQKSSRNWAVRFDHNHLRITRIMRCLRILGLQAECDAFFTALKRVYDDPAIEISERSMMYWHRAVSQPLYIAPDDDRCGWLKQWEEEQQE
ncbi:uncharacterized protein K460DRAFT_288077 [Cucurbitaria berberidis CBS 394.84]|uniref:Opioid growth factor receptor (OGFr) conserved domain-containing protein n=1 Tax=Cucurbitaria berberidis CBS 394.84 TaxID=1168544 RepID=A0A9P4GE35_9PLEO|nr:uncharacterized protein K460DRAFT_288077 [Cucurbitaria berberidis CBS 394.84]KAF1844273.1 hypothetical protein K460DRAFT_288077 [Cucurbitaria berberidis CBS 394.84]